MIMINNVILLIGGIGLPEIAIAIVLIAIIALPIILIIKLLLKVWRMSNDTRDIRNHILSKGKEEENVDE